MNKATICIALAGAVASVVGPARAQGLGPTNAPPKITLSCKAPLVCKGDAVFVPSEGRQRVTVRIAFDTVRLRSYLINKIQAGALPYFVRDHNFTISSIRSLDLKTNQDNILVAASFETTGNLSGVQDTSLLLHNGLTANKMFALRKGTLAFGLHGTYDTLLPAEMIPQDMLKDARSSTEKMISGVLAKTLSHEKLVSFISAPSTKVESVKVSRSKSDLVFESDVSLDKRDVGCALQRIVDYNQSFAPKDRIVVVSVEQTSRSIGRPCARRD